MYKFSKQSWHVKLFKWIFNEDPTKIYKSMCPYFWSYVLTILFLPLILIVKMFGKYGTQFLNFLRTYKEAKREKTKQLFLTDCKKENLTKEEAYRLYKSKCWKDFSCYLSYDEENLVRKLAKKVSEELYIKKEAVSQKKQQTYKEVKESKYFDYFAYLITGLIFTGVIYLFYMLFSSITFKPVDWILVFKLLVFVGGIVLVGTIIVLFVKYIIIPIINKIRCMECQLCKIGLGSKIISVISFIWKGFCIVGDMIHVTYKKNCPLIVWEEENN